VAIVFLPLFFELSDIAPHPHLFTSQYDFALDLYVFALVFTIDGG
jgi:hypothetical protein